MRMEGANGAFYDPELGGDEVPVTSGETDINPVFADWDAADAAELEAAKQWGEAIPTDLVEAAETASELDAVSPSEEVRAWAEQKERAIRRVGSQATWAGRRGIPDQHGHAERDLDAEVPVMKGRYVGPARITPKAVRFIAEAHGPDVAARIP